MARMGEIIDGKYEVLREVGRGGMSIVYLAMDKRLNKQWAIKEFRKDKDDASKQVALKALLDEANLMKKLDHPTLPRIVDIIENRETVYVIMDYIEGESLNKVLDAYGAQPQEAVIEWAKQLSEVLDYLHTQNPPVIYRDMKPANIMLKPDGTVRLIDFGIAREYKEGKEGDTEAIGTRGYAAPEQFGGKGQTDARTDIYSLGVTLYHLVTGKNPAEPPYEIYPIRHWNPSFSSGLEWLIQKCTQLNPGDRYQSCAEVTYVLENLDKFDTEYRKKKRSRFNLFLVSAILTAAFALTSGALLIGSNVAKQNSFDDLIANEKYIEALKLDDEKPETYLAFAKQLTTKLPEVNTGAAMKGTDIGGAISISDIDSWFSSARMDKLKEIDIKTYSQVQFELGLLMWQRYTSSNEGQQDVEMLQKAMPYFERVIDVANSNRDLTTAGLASEKEYNFAKILYCVTYFQNNRAKFDNTNNDLGRTYEIDEIAEFAGIDAQTFKDAPYRAYWETLEDTLDFISSDSTVAGESLKIKILERVNYIIGSTHHKFKSDGVTLESIKTFITKYEGVLKQINDIEQRNTLKAGFNKFVPNIRQAYDKAELEEIA